MSVVTRPFAGFYRTFSNDRPSHKAPLRLSDSDRVFDSTNRLPASSPLAPEFESFTLGTEPQGALVEAPRFDTTLEADSPREETWAALEVEKTLGQLMTDARNRGGLSRAEAADQTKIPEYYIRMIESDCYDAIPDQLYLLPFFERYAIFLGIDSQQVVTRFLRDFEKAENEIVAPAAASSSRAPASNVPHRWRRIAEAAAIVGILLPMVGWEVGRMHAANHHDPVVSRVATTSPATKALPPIQPNTAPPAVVAPPPAPPQQAVASSAAPVSPTVSVAPDQISPAPQTPIRSHRHSHSHRIGHHSRHLKRGIS